MKYTSSQSGFTLVELAIVLMIIGLLIGGILKGQELIENARITMLGRTMKSYEAALLTFQDSYGALPGDTNNATTRIPGCSAAHNCANGNVNGTIDGQVTYWYYGYYAIEPFQAWKHLALAGLISGIDTSASLGTYLHAGIEVPPTSFGQQTYIKSSGGNCQTAGQNMCGITIISSSHQQGDWRDGMSARIAQIIDLKFDDGMAMSGDVQAVSDGWADGCGDTTNGPNGYNVNASGRSCGLGFLITK